jgi:serine/threonine-protein kinase RsbW
MLMEESVSIQIESTAEALADVERMVDGVCETLSIPGDHYANILIAITEAVNNAIFHGNKQDPNKKITIDCVQESSRLQFVVQDQGEGFNYESLPDPTDPSNLEEPNGRGVFLMKSLADKVEFRDNGRRVELGFNLSAN